MKIIRTSQQNKAFQKLVVKLDAELALRDGKDHAFYHQFNGIEHLHHVVLACHQAEAVGCGAFKTHDKKRVEIKRMFVEEKYRRRGFAQHILYELERWATAMHYREIILETGKAQTEALSFYPKMQYAVMPNFAPYEGIKNSVCFKKLLVSSH